MSDTSKTTIMAGERIVFTEENAPQQYVKLIAAGEIDDILLDALNAFVDRQRHRLQRSAQSSMTTPLVAVTAAGSPN